MHRVFRGLTSLRRAALVFALVAVWLTALPGLAQPKAKNVLLMIADGAGHNTWRATSMYQGKLGQQVYDAPGWRHYLCSTFPLTRKLVPTLSGVQDPRLSYDPVKDIAPVALVADGPTTVSYDAEKPAALLDEDRRIGAMKLGIAPGAVRVTKVEDVFAR